MKDVKIFFITVFVFAISCKSLREMSQTKLTSETAKSNQIVFYQYIYYEVDSPKDTPAVLYQLLNQYRENNANIYTDLVTSDLTTNSLYGMAKTEVTSMLQLNSFGQHTNFNKNSEKFSAYSEVICMLTENHEGKAYEAAYNLWMTDNEIVKDIKNEYDFADANCQGYGNGWMCALLFSKN